MENANSNKGIEMVNVAGDLWYFVTGYMTDAIGNVVTVIADNGREYDLSAVKGLGYNRGYTGKRWK